MRLKYLKISIGQVSINLLFFFHITDGFLLMNCRNENYMWVFCLTFLSFYRIDFKLHVDTVYVIYFWISATWMNIYSYFILFLYRESITKTAGIFTSLNVIAHAICKMNDIWCFAIQVKKHRFSKKHDVIHLNKMCGSSDNDKCQNSREIK